MGKVVKFVISGHAAETDAPSAEDALDQLKDYLDILRGIEAAISEGQEGAIVWRIVSASQASPLTVSIEAFPKHYATNVDARVDLVVHTAAFGLHTLQEASLRPAFFTDDVLRRTQRIFTRTTNGLATSEADFGEGLPKSVLTPSIGRVGSKNISLVLEPIEKPFQAIGSVEGFLQAAQLDGRGRQIVYLRDRITGNAVKCLLAPKVRAELAERQISEIFAHRRVVAYGRIHYKSLTRISFIETTKIRFLRSCSSLPQIEDIIDRDFTGGIKSEDYLEMVRDAKSH